MAMALGFARLLLIAIIVACLTIHHVESTKGKGRQAAAKSGSAKKALQKSEERITSENLESNYVRLFFDQMKEEDRKSLELRMDELLLLCKRMSSEASSSSSSPKVNGVDKTELLTNKLHLVELKAILVPKNEKMLAKSQLAKRFAEASEEQMLEAKARMRRLAGRGVFLELEMRQPFLLRADLVEQSEYLAYNKELLSAPLVLMFLGRWPICRLQIPTIVGRMLRAEAQLPGPAANVRAEVEKRRKTVLRAIEKNIGDHDVFVTEETIPRLGQLLYKEHIALLVQQEKGGPATSPAHMEETIRRQLEEAESLGMAVDQKAIARAFFRQDTEHQLQSFIRRTRGARARYSRVATDIYTKEQLDQFLAWTESDLQNRLMFEYNRVLTAKSAVERLKSQMSADILVQVHFLDKQIGQHIEAIHQSQWLNKRNIILLEMDKMVDEDSHYAKDYGALYKHMLYKLRNRAQSNEGEHWDLDAFLDADTQIAAEWLEFDAAGKKRLPFLLVDPQQEAAAQAEWLDKKHQEMVEWLQQENAEFKEEFMANSSTPQGLVRSEALFNSHLQQTNSQENTEDEKGDEKTYNKCPKRLGLGYIRSDTKFHPYVQYLLEELLNHSRYQVEQDALLYAYEAAIADLLGAFPAKGAGKLRAKLREDWAKEMKNSFALTSATEDIKKVNTRRSICKAHSFLLRRLIKAELGPDVDEVEHEKWEQRLRKSHVSKTLVELLAKDPNYGSNFDANCEPEVAKEVVEKLITKEMPMQWPHFHYLGSLIRQYDEFRQIICHIHVDDRLGRKQRILDLLGEEYFGRMELLQPDVLHIENILPKMSMHFYGAYLEQFREDKGWNEMRIAVPLLVGRVRLVETKFKGTAEDKAMVESRVEWLLEEIFRDSEQLVGARSICLMVRFIVWNKSTKFAGNKADSGKGKRVPAAATAMIDHKEDAYSEERELVECARSEKQEWALKWQRKKLAAEHGQFLEKHPKLIGADIVGIPGRKTAILRLAPGLKLEWKADAYTNDDQLGAHFIMSLFTDDNDKNSSAARMSAHLGVNFASWHRWITSRLGMGNDNGLGIEMFAHLWDKSQQQMLVRHDALFCCVDVPIFEREKVYWAKMQAGLKNLLLQIPKLDVKDENLPSHVSATFADILLGNDQHWGHESWTDFNEWIQRKNQLELLDLWHWGWKDDEPKREEFRKNMRNGFDRIPAAKSRLIHLIGDDPKQLSLIVKVLEINLLTEDVPEDIDYLKAEEENDLSNYKRIENVIPDKTSPIGHHDLAVLEKKEKKTVLSHGGEESSSSAAGIDAK